MLKRLTVFVLLACVIGTYFSRDFAIAGFELNQKYIAEKLCVNKDKPWLHCNGRCYLMNKVKQAEDNEKRQDSKDLRSNLQVVWFVHPAGQNQRSEFNESIALQYKMLYTYSYTNQYNSSIFRPPKSVSFA